MEQFIHVSKINSLANRNTLSLLCVTIEIFGDIPYRTVTICVQIKNHVILRGIQYMYMNK